MMKNYLLRLVFFACVVCFGGALGVCGQDLVESSATLPGSGKPEHVYTMKNAQDYYVNGSLAPTRTQANYAQFAMYAVEGVANAYYIYNITAAKWLTYDKAASYDNQTGFLKMSDSRIDGTYFLFNNYEGTNYEISPYNTAGVEGKYLNWYRGVGSDNPLDGSVSLGLWRDRGSADNGSRWTFAEANKEYDYTVFSSGMPSNAVITIKGTEYRGVNAQGDTHFKAQTVADNEVSVVCGGGYVYLLSIDNANHQINVNFTQMFTPTASADAEEKSIYLLKMPAAYVCKSGTNLAHTTRKSEAARIIFIEDETNLGRYYIYNTTSREYIYYTQAANGSSVKTQSSSNVRTTRTLGQANTWQIVLRNDEESVSIIPGSVAAVSGSSPSWNFTGGIAQGCVLNLWSASDSNSAWQIIDPSAGSLPCATLMYALPGTEYMHKLVTNEGETIESIDFGALTNMELKSDRENVGNHYKYVRGYAPETEGEYSYTVNIRNADGDLETATVKLIVSSMLQSPTPMMGWLTWNWFARAISHDKVVAVVQGMQNKGLIDAGYNTIVLDDAWAEPTQDKSKLNYDAAKFPKGISGFKEACLAINPKIKVGIYSDAGRMTCENYQPGSYGFEAQHMALFDKWNVDMLKYDFCNSESSAYASYKAMGAAIAEVNKQRIARGDDLFSFNICEWGSNKPWTWGAEAGGCSWRSTPDARESWIGNHGRPGVLAGVDEVRNLWMWAGVNRFNDLDMMCIGLHGLGGPSNNTADHMSNGGVIAGLTDEQARSQMSLWSMLASPLALTADFRATPKAEANNSAGTLPKPLITNADLATLTNAQVIAINQDVLGQQAEYMAALSTGTTMYSATGYDVYVKDLSESRVAVAVINRGGTAITGPNLNVSDLYLDASTEYNCLEAWNGLESTVTGVLSTGKLKGNETKIFILEDANATAVSSAQQSAASKPAAKTYNLQGQVVSASTAGIVIENGMKIRK